MAAYLTLGLAGLTLGGFCLRVGHPLWGRFDFKSQLIWVTMEGNYQAAKIAFGNQFTDRIKTQKQVINIETMTLRVWVAELQFSTIFDCSPWIAEARERTVISSLPLRWRAEYDRESPPMPTCESPHFLAPSTALAIA